VSSQADSEAADLALERRELAASPEAEKAELAGIYVARGLTPELAIEVADQLTARDALGAHARDELGFFAHTAARPVQAAVASAIAFAVGATVPVVVAVIAPTAWIGRLVTASALVVLLLLGAVAAHIGGAGMKRGAFRVVLWGALAMAASAGVGRLFGTQVP
jgi:VIT1/CCC1 family predicted Fe2+/Mn2+ transporter